MDLIVGLGKTGKSIARYLKQRQKSFAIFDTRAEVAGLTEFKQKFNETPIFLQKFPPALYQQLERIILSPGVAPDEQFIQQALQYGLPIYGDIECLAQEINVPVVAITGTNGKSTVTTIVGEMAKLAGFSVAVAGNIGTPVLELLDDGNNYNLWVIELSSFQLDLTYSLKPYIATILNISPDHLDRYPNLAAYSQSKQLIYNRAEFALYNRDDLATKPLHFKKNKLLAFGLDLPTTNNWGIVEKNGISYFAHGKNCLFPTAELHINGKQNWQNALAACAIATILGIDSKLQIKILQNFIGLKHRCQWIRTLANVSWVNDSKGTNVGATISAINGIGATIKGKIILIAGGIGKGADFNELRVPIAHYVRALVLIGQDANKIAAAVKDVVLVKMVNSLNEAVLQAQLVAMDYDLVLLSPACASFDMFRDFNHRGEVFMQLVRAL